ncbi:MULTISPECIES: LapA family protein [Shewanella]|uniref:LapA family protein n=1 Tax=Shewanella TaxID=22 RepID=UPI000491ED1A|nr:MULTISPECIES: LapA family protein [Shewanella]QLE85541.1 LapA family protein [Shewanella sp. Scap07]
MKSFIVTILVALFFVLALIFGARNEQVVTISYFVAQGEYRLPVVLAVVFLAGFLVSWLFAIYHITRMRLTVRALKKENQLLQGKQPPVETAVSVAKDANA